MNKNKMMSLGYRKSTKLNENFTLMFDAWNRLVKVAGAVNVIANYTYDGLNRRVKKTLDNETRLYYYNRSWQCVEEFVNTTVQSRYFWGLRYIDDLLVYRTGSTDYFVLQDTNWNVIALSSATGSILERYTYTAFGKRNVFDTNFVAKSQSSLPTFTRSFTGQVLDAETNLLLYRNRHYHPDLGRFVQRDPIGYDADDENLYRYAENTPSMLSDLLGLETSTPCATTKESKEECELKSRPPAEMEERRTHIGDKKSFLSRSPTSYYRRKVWVADGEPITSSCSEPLRGSRSEYEGEEESYTIGLSVGGQAELVNISISGSKTFSSTTGKTWTQGFDEKAKEGIYYKGFLARLKIIIEKSAGVSIRTFTEYYDTVKVLYGATGTYVCECKCKCKKD